MRARRNSREAQQSGHAPRSGPEVNDGRRRSTDGTPERLRCWTVQKKVSYILHLITAGAARSISGVNESVNETDSNLIALTQMSCAVFILFLLFPVLMVVYNFSNAGLQMWYQTTNFPISSAFACLLSFLWDRARKSPCRINLQHIALVPRCCLNSSHCIN